MAAAAVCALPTANAAQVTIIGTVLTGTDRTGVFGFAPGTSLAGQKFTFVYTINTGNEQYTYYPNSNAPYVCFVTGQGNTTASSPVSADLTINNHTYSFGKLPVSSTAGSASRNVHTGQVPTQNLNNNEAYYVSSYQGIGQLAVGLAFNNPPPPDCHLESPFSYTFPTSGTANGSFDFDRFQVSGTVKINEQAAVGTLIATAAGVSGPPPKVGKNLGGPCPPVTPDVLQSSPANPSTDGMSTCGCPGSDPVPTTAVGNPINAATGNKFQVDTDFTAASCTGLALRRYYNSQDTTNSALGTGWRSAWQRSVILIPGGTAIIFRADGREDTFTFTAGAWQADPDVTSRLTALLNTANQQIGWRLVTAADTTETYSLAGQLTAVTTRAGLTTTLAYNAGGQLTTVTGPFGDTLRFVNDASGRITQMTVPDGGVFAYAYDASNNLVSVTHPDGSIRKYLYGGAPFPHALTGIIDEDGNAYASWTYDAEGRAVTSQHAGGADRTTVAYNANGTASATDADGNTHTYTFGTQFNVVKPTALSGAPYPSAGGQAFTYDSNGFVASKTDYDGNVTTYTHDTRGDQTSRTEAAGTALARTISTSWLSNFHLPTSVTEPGRVSSFSYDARGNLLQKTIAAGSLTRSWAYTYNSDGQVLTAADSRGNVTRYTYDSAGDIASITDALGHVTAFTSYDADGRPLSITDPNGLVTTLAHNFRGEVTSRNVGGEVTPYAYDPAGQLIKLTRPDGSFFTFTYDAAHRLTGIKDAVGDSIANTYDPNSNLTARQVFNPSGTLTRTRSYTYDQVNRLAKAIGALGQTTAYAYDPNSNLTGVVDPLSDVSAYHYDALNRLAQAIDPKGGPTDYGYDALDHLTGVTDPRDLTTSYTWDGLDDQTAVTSPDSGITVRTFDAAGNVASSTDARALTTTYKYDALNRPIQATYADSRSVTRQYDQGTYGVGHLTAMTDLSGSTTWTYDQHGRVLTKKQTTGGLTFTTAMSYDAAGRLASVTYPSGIVITVFYDAASRVSALSSGATALVSGVAYFPFGPAETWTQGNAAIYSRSFDQDGRIDSIGFDGSAIALSYDLASRITGITETGLPNKIFGYDQLDRLTVYTSGSTTLSYGYDPNGNRNSLGAGNTATSYRIDPGSNRLLGSTGSGTRTLSYDADGNVIADSQPLVNYAYTYDATGRLVTAKTGGFTTSYTNDGLGERLTRSGYGASTLPGGKEEFVYDPAGHLLGEYDGNGKAIQETVWLGSLPVAVLVPGMTPLYVAPDHLGSPHQIADASRGTVWSWDHDPFGNGAPTGSLSYNLRFPGQYFNQETGLHYNGFRDYDPTSGRYVQSDPIGLLGGINSYAYTRNSPLINIDPFGMGDDTVDIPIIDPNEPYDGFKNMRIGRNLILYGCGLEATGVGLPIALAVQGLGGIWFLTGVYEEGDYVYAVYKVYKASQPFGPLNPNTPLGPLNPGTPFGNQNPNPIIPICPGNPACTGPIPQNPIQTICPGNPACTGPLRSS